MEDNYIIVSSFNKQQCSTYCKESELEKTIKNIILEGNKIVSVNLIQ